MDRIGVDHSYDFKLYTPWKFGASMGTTVGDYLERYGDPAFYSWAIDRNGELAGTIGAYDYDAAASSIEVGFSIAEPSWGKGYASEALCAVLRYLVDDERIAQVRAWCASDNVGSRRVLEKCGMVLTNTEKGALAMEDETFDRLDFVYEKR